MKVDNIDYFTRIYKRFLSHETTTLDPMTSAVQIV